MQPARLCCLRFAPCAQSLGPSDQTEEGEWTADGSESISTPLHNATRPHQGDATLQLDWTTSIQLSQIKRATHCSPRQSNRQQSKDDSVSRLSLTSPTRLTDSLGSLGSLISHPVPPTTHRSSLSSLQPCRILLPRPRPQPQPLLHPPPLQLTRLRSSLWTTPSCSRPTIWPASNRNR